MNQNPVVIFLSICSVSFIAALVLTGCDNQPPYPPIPKNVFFPGDIVAHVLNEEVGGVIIEMKEVGTGYDLPPGTNYRVRRLDIIFSDVWLSEAELVLLRESTTRPVRVRQAPKAKKFAHPPAEAEVIK